MEVWHKKRISKKALSVKKILHQSTRFVSVYFYYFSYYDNEKGGRSISIHHHDH